MLDIVHDLRSILALLDFSAIAADLTIMAYAPTQEFGKQDQPSKDRELEEILRLAEAEVDDETRRFVDEVLKFVPSEPQPEIQVFTSHRGAGDAR